MTKQTKTSSKLGSLTPRHPSRPSLVGSGGFRVASKAELAQLQKDLNRGLQVSPIAKVRQRKRVKQ